MERMQHEKKPDEAWMPVTVPESDLISHLIYQAIHHMKLDDESRKMATNFMVKLQRAALSSHIPISKQPPHELR